MGYPDHYLLQFGGTLGSATGEIWSCGIRLVLQNVGPDPQFDPADGYLTTIAVPALSAWVTRASSKISSVTRLTFAKCNEINADGDYANSGVTNEYFYPAGGVAGGGGAGSLPFQASVCLSWETNAAQRGLASKGRIYSPHPAVTVSATGLFPTADALGMATSAKDLLNALDDSVQIGQIRPHIVSRGRRLGPDSYGPGAANEINIVRVDNRVDIQRRRANQLVAASSVVPFSY